MASRLKQVDGTDLYGFAITMMLIYEIIFRDSVISRIPHTVVDIVIWTLISISLFFKVFIIDRFSPKQILEIILIFAISVLSTYFSRQVSLLKFFLFSVSLLNVDIEFLIKKYVKLWVVLGTLVIILSVTGIISNSAIGFRYGRYRYSLGFIAPATIGLLFTNLNYYIYTRTSYGKLFKGSILIISIFVLWYVVNCQTAAVVLVMMVILFYFKSKFESIYFHPVVCIVPVLIAFICVYITILYDPRNPIMQRLNGLLSLRVYYANQFYKLAGIHLLGSDYQDVTSGLHLDNAYISLLVRFGVVPFLYIVYIYTKVLYHSMCNRDSATVIGIIISCVYGITEMTLYTFGYNVIIMLVMYIYINEIIFKPNEEDIQYSEDLSED